MVIAARLGEAVPEGADVAEEDVTEAAVFYRLEEGEGGRAASGVCRPRRCSSFLSWSHEISLTYGLCFLGLVRLWLRGQ